MELAGEFPIIYASVGIHPHYAKATDGKIPDEMKEAFLKKNRVVAIGEVGLDYYRNLSPKELQKSLFIDFINLARKRDLPIIIHAREADEDTCKILERHSKGSIRGVMHCFSQDEEYLKRYLDLGLCISFTCNLTFKNARDLRNVARKVPIERLLLETDAPFMAPQEFRGKRNEPAYLSYLVKELASIHGLSMDDIARTTTHNAKTLFGLPVKEDSRVAYSIRDSLYLNITNRCTNNCDFCTKRLSDFVKGHNLRLDHEPTAEEIIQAMGDPRRYKEVVFCGYGEPTLRLDLVKKIAAHIKKKKVPTRMVTNGEGDLIHKRRIAKELSGVIDRVSVSLNVDTDRMYDEICKSRFGKGVFNKVKEFVKECKAAGIEVELTFLDLPGVDIKRCKKIAADELGVDFRMRRLNVVG